jgi:hypothetical protein
VRPDGGGETVHFYAEAAQQLDRGPVFLAEQAEEEMLRADVFLVEAEGFFLSEGEDSAGVFVPVVEIAVGHGGPIIAHRRGIVDSG